MVKSGLISVMNVRGFGCNWHVCTIAMWFATLELGYLYYALLYYNITQLRRLVYGELGQLVKILSLDLKTFKLSQHPPQVFLY